MTHTFHFSVCELQPESFIEQDGVRRWSEKLQAGFQHIYKPSLAIALDIPPGLYSALCCFKWAVNLQVGLQGLLHPIFPLSAGAHFVNACVFVSALMAAERSFGVSPYKYERAVGVKRVRTAGPLTPTAAALHPCSE